MAIYGVGVNDADYVVQPQVKGKQVMCPFYKAWITMLMRCYSPKYQASKPTYIGCTVSDEWLHFTTFRSWMEGQKWEGLQLDKDLLIDGNREYSQYSCLFVSSEVNGFLLESQAARGDLPIGVYWYKATGKYRAQCSVPKGLSGVRYLGTFDTVEEASLAYKVRKSNLAHELAEVQTDKRVSDSLIKKFNFNTIGGK